MISTIKVQYICIDLDYGLSQFWYNLVAISALSNDSIDNINRKKLVFTVTLCMAIQPKKYNTIPTVTCGK